MSFKAVCWTLLTAIAAGAVALFNYWAPWEFLSLIAYSGLVLTVCGLANAVIPFRFLGVRRRCTGLWIASGGAALAAVGLCWPGASVRVAEHRCRLDDVLPEYQGSEVHSIRIHAPTAQVMEAVRQSTMGDLRSLAGLLRIRAAVMRTPYEPTGGLRDKPMVDLFAMSGYVIDRSERELVIFTAANVRTTKHPEVHTLQEFTAYREPGAVKTAFDFRVRDAGGGWSILTTETRVLGMDELSAGPGTRYWRLILPGSGLLRREWLSGIRSRAEAMAAGAQM